MTANCTFRLPTDHWYPDRILDNARLGKLTTNHAASSYGLPVVVGDDGTAYGPADIEDGAIDLTRYAGEDADGHEINMPAAEYAALKAAASAAGYTVG